MDVEADRLDTTQWGKGRVPKVVQEEDTYPSIEEDEFVDIREFHYFRDTGKLTASFFPKKHTGCFFVVFRRNRVSDVVREAIEDMYSKADYEGIAYDMKFYKEQLFPFLNALKDKAKPEILRRMNDPVCLRVTKVLKNFKVPEGYELYRHTKKEHRHILDFGVRVQKIGDVPPATSRATSRAQTGKSTISLSARSPMSARSTASMRGPQSLSAREDSSRSEQHSARGGPPSAREYSAATMNAEPGTCPTVPEGHSANSSYVSSSCSSSSSSHTARALSPSRSVGSPTSGNRCDSGSGISRRGFTPPPISTAQAEPVSARSDRCSSPTSSRALSSRPPDSVYSQDNHEYMSFGDYYNSDEEEVDESRLPVVTYFHCLANDDCRNKKTVIPVRRFVPKFRGQHDLEPECSNVTAHLKEKHWNMLLQAGYKSL